MSNRHQTETRTIHPRSLAELGEEACCIGGEPSDPVLAADAIERYVYDGSQDPWHLPDDAA